MSNERELRILQIVKGIDIGGHNGGSENFGIRLARQLRQEGADVSLCAYFRHNTSVEAEWADCLKGEGIRLVFANRSYRLNLWEGYWSLARFIKEHSVNLIHSHFQTGTLTSILLKSMRNIDCIVRTAHTPLEFGTGWPGLIARNIFVNGIYPFVLDREIGVSRVLVNALDARLSAQLAGKKAVCIHNAVSEVVQTPQTNNPFTAFMEGMTEPPWIMTMIGILNPLKNFDTAIRALPVILADIPNARLALVGNGPEELWLRQLAIDLGVADQVWFLGQRGDIATLLANSNLFIHPSLLEALSTVLLEALQYGVPVVASDIPGNRELIKDGENGRFFPPKDVASLAKIILEMHQFPERGRDYVQEGYHHLGPYAISVVTDAYLQLYRELTRLDAS